LREAVENFVRYFLRHAHGLAKKGDILRLQPLFDFIPILLFRSFVQATLLFFRSAAASCRSGFPVSRFPFPVEILYPKTGNRKPETRERFSKGFSVLTRLGHAFIIAATKAGASCGSSHFYIRSLQQLNFGFVFQGKDC
jgi:hypothetical protein